MLSRIRVSIIFDNRNIYLLIETSFKIILTHKVPPRVKYVMYYGIRY